MSLPFELYTRYYDLLYRDKDYAGEAEYVAAAIRRHAPGATRILELGCGTGGHAEHLARQGFTVHGIDLSDGMVARAEARRAALPAELAQRLRFGLGDVRSVRVGAGQGAGTVASGGQPGAAGAPPAECFDAVVSLFHVMSYQTTNADLAAAYATAAAHLAPGGVFLYDHWYGPAVLTQRPEARVRRLADGDLCVMRIAEPVLHWARNVCDVNYTLVVQQGEGPLHQFQETHPMRYLFEPELALLEGPAWQLAEQRAWLGDTPPDPGSWAALRVLRRA